MFPYSLTLRAHAEAVRPCFLRKRPMEGRLRVPLLDRIHCSGFPDRADDGVRTRGLLLGKQACCHCTTSASRPAGGRCLAYSITGARRLDMTSFLGMSALTRGGMPHVVEPAGFEPATFPLRTGRPATGRRPRNAPDGIRTCNLPIRRPTLRIRLSCKGVHPAHATACVPARAGMRNGSWRWHGPGRGRRRYPSRMPSFPRAESVRRRVRATFTP